MIVPFELEAHSRVLVAGCGGGFDVLSAGFPIGRALEARGHEVVYSSYTFSQTEAIENGDVVEIGFLRIHAESTSRKSYFPEKWLSRWYLERTGTERPVYLYAGQGVQPLIKVFDYLHVEERLDAIFVVDGGSDGILRGDEYDLGTPEIDSISVVAGSLCQIPTRYYVLSAFGSEGVAKLYSHAQVLERMSELIREDRALGGDFGDTVVNTKTVLAPIWVSALTTLLWYFDLDAVAAMKLKLEELVATEDFFDALRIFGMRLGSRPISEKPVIPI